MPIDFDIPHSGFDIRPSTSDDAKAMRMLLPELRDPALALIAFEQ